MEEEAVYQVRSVENKYQVIDNNQRIIIECRDEQNARHYAVLLNSAFSKGYKTGYKDGRSK